MSEFYFINQQIVIAEKKAVLDSIQSDVPIDPVDVLTGAKLNPEPSKIDITLADSSGDFFPDMFSTPITVVSDKLKKAFDDCGVKNIDFYPVRLLDMKNQKPYTGYWFANILGRFSCLDESKSDVRRNALGNLKFKSFQIDDSKIMGADVFRLDERGRMIIISEKVYAALAELNLKGVMIKNTRDFDGYGI